MTFVKKDFNNQMVLKGVCDNFRMLSQNLTKKCYSLYYSILAPDLTIISIVSV